MFGILKNGASIIGVKSTIPTIIDNMYPVTIPIKNGIILKNPFAPTAVIAVTRNVIIDTRIIFQSNTSAVRPICAIAFGASENPIIMIIGPITTGGNNLSIQSLPKIFIINDTNM